MEEELKGTPFISPKEIQRLRDCHYVTALREHQKIRKDLGKKGKKLTVKEYCDYHQIDYQQIVKYLNHYR